MFYTDTFSLREKRSGTKLEDELLVRLSLSADVFLASFVEHRPPIPWHLDYI